jgi:menaquinone-dependent protoporphyrinogen IX oxidase
MKILVVYYSRNGNNKKLAEALAGMLRADIDEIIPEKRYSGKLGWLKGGFHGNSEKVINISTAKNPERYDLVIVGFPIWAGKMASPALSYLKKHKIHKLAVFSSSGAGTEQKVLQQIKDLGLNVEKSMFIAEKEIKENMHNKKLIEFYDGLKKVKVR